MCTDDGCQLFHRIVDIREKASNVVRASVELFLTIRRELLPTPSKSHYTFNLRDLAKIFQGVSLLSLDVDLVCIPHHVRSHSDNASATSLCEHVGLLWSFVAA